ncbi:hypothetical protein [Comamonas sp. JC664]|uniref:hypothetical protein n=1 Tax=Comamonas sp. JC664 TaxID=2801917 RepID=UPI00174DD340|nr:hypothetical protein [Comamonas sp. JC664]MBL0693254.1 hypothetical protein [Comamonas sp. JC664]GHG97642.1 hypothetical protein GCM10012319_62760 [Comamonas sp. KCTC 72670]
MNTRMPYLSLLVPALALAQSQAESPVTAPIGREPTAMSGPSTWVWVLLLVVAAAAFAWSATRLARRHKGPPPPGRGGIGVGSGTNVPRKTRPV